MRPAIKWFARRDASAKPPRLVLRFAVLTALALAAAAASMLWFLRQDITSRAQQTVAAQARSIAYTTLREVLEPSDFRRPASSARRRVLDRLLTRRVIVEGAGIVRIKLLSPEGTVTYSDEHTLIGRVEDDLSELRRALRGETVLRVGRLDDTDASGPNPKTLKAYVPVRLGGGVRTTGVLEVSEDYSPVARETREALRSVAAILGLTLLALYAAFLPLLRRVTKRLEARAHAEASERALARENERLRKLDRLKDDFVSSVSHELRTPLTSIRGYLELMREEDADELTDQQERFLEIIDRNTDRLLRLVGELLFVAHAEANRVAADLPEVDVAQLARECVEAARPVADQAGIALGLEAEEVEGAPGDRDYLSQLLDNLISNALKFTPEGGRVDVKVLAADGRVRVEVSDTGIGIPIAEQDEVFDRFFRSAAAGEQAIPGTGLGLSIAKSIAEAHGGRIGLDSEEGAGSTFWFELPVRPDAAAEAIAAA